MLRISLVGLVLAAATCTSPALAQPRELVINPPGMEWGPPGKSTDNKKWVARCYRDRQRPVSGRCLARDSEPKTLHSAGPNYSSDTFECVWNEEVKDAVVRALCVSIPAR